MAMSMSGNGRGRVLPNSGWLVLPLAIWTVARIISGVLLAVAARAQPDLTHDPNWHVEGRRPASPSYWEVLSNWDGQWYMTIAVHGYPAEPPDGFHSQNVYAFYPLYPMTVGFVMRATGLSFELVAGCLSLIAGLVAAVLLFRWLEQTRGRAVALAAVCVLAFFPSAPVFQVAYSDALGFALLVVCLRATVERRWAHVLIVAPILSLTRPLLLPLVAFVIVLEIKRLISRREGDPSWSHKPFMAAAAFTALAFAWPVIVWARTGRSSAYFEAAASWVRVGGLTGGWLRGMWDLGYKVLAITFIVLLLALIALRWHRRRECSPPDEIGSWGSMYLLYILGTTAVNMSVVRYTLLTLVPLGTFGPMALARIGRWRRSVLLALVLISSLVMQWWWVAHVFVVTTSPATSWPP